jgi:hypothetical protein
MPADQLWALPDGPVKVVFDDGVVETNARATIYSAYMWRMYTRYPKTPALTSHHLGERRIGSDTHLDLLGNVMWDWFQDYNGEVDVETLSKLVYEDTNRIYNDFTYRLESYVRTLSILDFMEVINHPEIKTANEQVQPTQLAIDHCYKKIKEVLRDPTIGLNARELAEQILTEELENELLDPKERQLRDMERELSALRAAREEEARAKQEAELSVREQAEVAKWTKVYQEEFPKALAAAGLPLNPSHVEALKNALISDLERGLDTPLEALAKEVKEELRSSQKSYVSELDPETLFDLLGPDNYKRLSEFVSQKHRPAPPPKEAAPKKEASLASTLTKEERIARMAKKLQELG